MSAPPSQKTRVAQHSTNDEPEGLERATVPNRLSPKLRFVKELLDLAGLVMLEYSLMRRNTSSDFTGALARPAVLVGAKPKCFPGNESGRPELLCLHDRSGVKHSNGFKA
jgi:hypothetical protein